MTARFVLANAEEKRARFPTSFEIPSAELRAGCRPGDFAKLIFVDSLAHHERMWVKVEEARAGKYVGVLNNEPLFKDTMPPLGTRVEFGAEHIIAINHVA